MYLHQQLDSDNKAGRYIIIYPCCPDHCQYCDDFNHDAHGDDSDHHILTNCDHSDHYYSYDHADHQQMDFDGQLVRHSAAITTQFVRDEHAELNDNDPLT